MLLKTNLIAAPTDASRPLIADLLALADEAFAQADREVCVAVLEAVYAQLDDRSGA